MTNGFGPARIALIGCGAVAENYYAPALRRLENAGQVQLAALYDPEPENLAKLAKVFPDATAVNQFAQVKSLGKSIQLAIIASPVRYHAEQSIELTRSGMSVLCEKPMAASSAACMEMIEAANQTGCPLAVGMLRRFYPATQLIRQMIERRILGDVKFFEFLEGVKFSWPARSFSFFDKKQAAGGVLLDLGVHVLDLLIWWFGQPEEVLYEDDTMGGIETNCRLNVRYRGGVFGTVRLSRDTPMLNRYSIQFDNGQIVWHINDINRIEIEFNGRENGSGAIANGSGASILAMKTGAPLASLEEILVAQLKNVLAAIRQEGELIAPAHEACKSVALIESCYRERTLIKMPWLSETELAAARKLAEVV
jgi:predicted dehydrogenase